VRRNNETSRALPQPYRIKPRELLGWELKRSLHPLRKMSTRQHQQNDRKTLEAISNILLKGQYLIISLPKKKRRLLVNELIC